MKFITVATVAALLAAAQCAPAAAPVAVPAPWFWEKEWDHAMCNKSTHKNGPTNPLLNDFCRANCNNCVSMKLDCRKKLTKVCNI
ncbi:uncharacterized protein DFL_003626 [Arthrobotrys flagrans]|uniref:ShKT domain-containing protein n=1 Tax=Arthrobotrys flagrans TaxID=97331 RepID=A0A437A2I7_ARTFL|nr:hypothetical protein DFL_003626 [Arthrobotrys flagrans]